jgi:hypothetical protein
MASLTELEKTERDLLEKSRIENEIVSIRLDSIEFEKKILLLIENTPHCERLEKYIATIGDHFYYNKKTRTYKKVFDIRNGSVSQLLKNMKESYLSFKDSPVVQGLDMHAKCKNELNKLKHIFRRPGLSKENDGDSGGNRFTYDTKPLIKGTNKLNPNFSKSIVILSWSVDEKGNILSTIQCKRIKAEWIEYPVKDRLRNSIFGTENEWEVHKQKRGLKESFKKIKLILDESFDYHSTGDERLIKSFCIGMLDEHLQKISNTRKNSLRFGL